MEHDGVGGALQHLAARGPALRTRGGRRGDRHAHHGDRPAGQAEKLDRLRRCRAGGQCSGDQVRTYLAVHVDAHPVTQQVERDDLRRVAGMYRPYTLRA
ncbi:hypothetical protein AB0K23_38170 [Streptomyces sp. NPDC049602]|uniref:hypothetical protein n=1 Tax=Streptomyces sp. NPDC049602 TaxID=3155504 RepID=UPI00343C7D9D